MILPEIVTEHPGAVLHKLEAAGGRCGEEEPREILVDCPPERFCAMPEGEICVYGIDEIPQMAVTRTETFAEIVCPPSALPWSGQELGFASWLLTVALAWGLGLWIGRRRGRGD